MRAWLCVLGGALISRTAAPEELQTGQCEDAACRGVRRQDGLLERPLGSDDLLAPGDGVLAAGSEEALRKAPEPEPDDKLEYWYKVVRASQRGGYAGSAIDMQEETNRYHENHLGYYWNPHKPGSGTLVLTQTWREDLNILLRGRPQAEDKLAAYFDKYVGTFEVRRAPANAASTGFRFRVDEHSNAWAVTALGPGVRHDNAPKSARNFYQESSLGDVPRQPSSFEGKETVPRCVEWYYNARPSIRGLNGGREFQSGNAEGMYNEPGLGDPWEFKDSKGLYRMVNKLSSRAGVTVQKTGGRRKLEQGVVFAVQRRGGEVLEGDDPEERIGKVLLDQPIKEGDTITVLPEIKKAALLKILTS